MKAFTIKVLKFFGYPYDRIAATAKRNKENTNRIVYLRKKVEDAQTALEYATPFSEEWYDINKRLDQLLLDQLYLLNELGLLAKL